MRGMRSERQPRALSRSNSAAPLRKRQETTEKAEQAGATALGQAGIFIFLISVANLLSIKMA